LAGGGGLLLLMQPDNIDIAINALAHTFMSVSGSFDSQRANSLLEPSGGVSGQARMQLSQNSYIPVKAFLQTFGQRTPADLVKRIL